MKKNLLLFVAIFFFSMATKIYAESDTLAVMIWAEDAVGNKDTVFIYIKDGATDGLDPELGEVNLYGVEPQGDLDLRIIQRTDTNYFVQSESMDKAFWLCGEPLDTTTLLHNELTTYSKGWVPTYLYNADFKTKYVSSEFMCCNRNIIPISISTQHYPINIHYESTDYDALWIYYGAYIMCMAAHNINGDYVKLDNINTFFSPIVPSLVYTANDSNECHILSFYIQQELGIEDTTATIYQIFPNPSGDYITINNLENIEIHLLNTNGRIVDSFFILESPYIFYISHLPIGTYFLVSKTNNFINKFIKENR